VALLVGVVAIGRNEGERLERCLRSALAQARAVVYVDSGSSDGSVPLARRLGAAVVELDPARPFTAARARNEGFARLERELPGLELVQFVDGDCELQPGWIAEAEACVASHPEVAAVCGRRRERSPAASPWNRLADLEWDTPVGDARAFGGDVLMRARVLREVGGYDEARIAGEDPELSRRIRRAGHRIARIDREMTLHDAALDRFRKWWRRQVRAGHAFAEALWRERHLAEPETRRPVFSAAFWGGALPLLALAGATATGGGSLVLLLGAYALLGARIFRAARRRGRTPGDAALYAAGLVLGKFAELEGALTFAWNHLVRRRATGLIEYKRT
jgi:glycosyltransferase involved in cell wall biosynthesis